MAEAVTIRTMLHSDFTNVRNLLADAKGWNTSKNVLLAARALDPDGFLVAVDAEGEIVGMIAGCNLDEDNAFVGYFLVKEALQGKGIGRQLFRMATDHMGQRNKCLNGNFEVLNLYRNKGYGIKTFTAKMYVGQRSEYVDSFLADHRDVTVVDFQMKYHQALLDYDNLIHYVPRQRFIDQFIAPETVTLLALKNDVMVGYGCVQPRDPAYKSYFVSPVYAEDDDTALLILVQLLKKIPRGKFVYINILDTQEHLRMPYISHLETCFEYQRLYTKHDIPLPLHKVYALSSAEVALI